MLKDTGSITKDNQKTLIRNADWIITMDSAKSRFQNSDILIEGAKILAIGRNLPSDGVDQIVEAKGRVIIPGLVCTHQHLCESLTRNLNALNGTSLMEWLDVIYAIMEETTKESVEASTLVTLGGMLKTGCTTSNDQPFAFPTDKPYKNELVDQEIQAARRIGIRFHPLRGSMTLPVYEGCTYPSVLVEDEDDVLQDSERLFKQYHDRERFSMCRVGVGPDWHGFDSTERLQVESLALARKYGGQYHTHINESKESVAFTKEMYGVTPSQLMQKLGILGEDVYFAHCTQMTDDDIAMFAETGTGVAHCIKSNMLLSCGIAPVPKMRQAGINVGIGLDGPASNNDMNIMAEMRVAFLAHAFVSAERGYRMSSEDILEMATVGGARVLGRDDIGYLAEGMAADLVLMDWSQFQYIGGQYNPVDAIVQSGDARMVDTVFVNGEIVVRKGILTKIDETEVAHWAREVGQDVIRKASKHISSLEQDIR